MIFYILVWFSLKKCHDAYHIKIHDMYENLTDFLNLMHWWYGVGSFTIRFYIFLLLWNVKTDDYTTLRIEWLSLIQKLSSNVASLTINNK